MRAFLRHLIPSMFHRRLLLLFAVACGALLVLGTQTARLTLGTEGHRRRNEAERVLVDSILVPTLRGQILDRHGRVLAHDEPGWDIRVSYDVIVDRWAYQQALRAARRASGPKWAEWNAFEREAVIGQFLPAYEQRAQAFWQTLGEVGGVSREEIQRRRDEIRHRVQMIVSDVTARSIRRREEQTGEELSWQAARVRVLEETRHHSILQDVSDETRRLVQAFVAEAYGETEQAQAQQIWREVRIDRPRQRRYPYETMTVSVPTATMPSPLREQFQGQPQQVTIEGVASHLLGRMRNTYREDVETRPFRWVNEVGERQEDLGGYLPGDRAGAFGFEAAYEHWLRGSRGRIIMHLDTGEQERIEPVPGEDLRLAIDIQLQARIQALLSPEIGLMTSQPWHRNPDLPDGTPLTGAALVMDLATGEIVAAVSHPPMPRRLLESDPTALYQDQFNAPTLNRAISAAYQPGSVVKPLVLAAAVTDEKLRPDEKIGSPGYLWENSPNLFRDWLYKDTGMTFGEIDGIFAVARSANVFFGQLVGRMGADRLSSWLEAFGVGQPMGVGLPEEARGILPDPNRDVAERVKYQEACFMSIGQGPITWTLVQAAGAYGRLVHRGPAPPPTLVDPGHWAPEERRPAGRPLSHAAVVMTLEGMRQSANERIGTTARLGALQGERIFNLPRVRIYGKSGTAQAAPLRRAIDDDGDGRPDRWGEILKEGNHAWVLAMAQPEGTPQPTHVVVVIVEYAGSGGQVAGPIVNQIFHAMHALGYLGEPPADAPQVVEEAGSTASSFRRSGRG